MTNPFEIPELRHYLATFLSKKTLLVCVLVCKSWNESFTHLLYYSTTISHYRPPYKFESLERNYIHVKSLQLETYVDPAYQALNFSNLVTLKTKLSNDSSGITNPSPVSASNLSRFIKNSKNTLSTFKLATRPSGEMHELWDALLCCSKITHLDIRTIQNMSVHPIGIEAFISLLTRVTNLRLWCLRVVLGDQDLQRLPTLIQSSNLVDFKCCGIGLDRNHLGRISLHLLSKSPKLRSIDWSTRGGYAEAEMTNENNRDVYRELMASIRSECFNRFKSYGSMSDSDHALLLRAMTGAKTLMLDKQCFGRESYTAFIGKHSNTITTLCINRCREVASSTVQGILSKCPSLILFEAGYIRGTDLVLALPSTPESIGDQENITLGEDWVCLKLKKLSLYFDLSSVDANIDRSTADGEILFQRQQRLEQFHSFRQLSRLQELNSLDISPHYFQPESTTLNLKLKANGGELEQLCTLKALSIFHPLDFGSEEMRWADEFWSLK